jgi:hypothetical protein
MKGNNSTTVEGMQTASQHYVSKVKRPTASIFVYPSLYQALEDNQH